MKSVVVVAAVIVIYKDIVAAVDVKVEIAAVIVVV